MAIFSFNEALKKSGATASDVKPVGVNSGTPIPTGLDKGYVSSVGADYAKAGQDITSAVQSGADAIQSGLEGKSNPLQVAGGLLNTGLQTAGAVAGAAFSPITNAPGVKQGLEAVGGAVAKIPGVDSIVASLNELATKHPQISKDIGAIVNLATLGAGGVTEKPIAKIAGDVGSKTIDTVGAGIVPTINKTGTAIKTLGEKATGVGVSMTEPTKIAMQAYEAQQPSLLGRVKNFITGVAPEGTKPITEANTAVRQGLAGTEWQIGVQAKKASSEIFDNVIQPALDSSKEKISRPQFFNDLKAKIISETSDLSRRNTLLNALESFSDDYKHVSNFGLGKLQQYKEGWAKFVPEKAYKGNPIAGALNEVRNMAAGQARSIIYDKLGPAVKTAYLDYGNLQSIKEAGIKSIDALRSKSPSRQVWEAILDRAVTPIATFAGQVLYKAGSGLELVGKNGAKTIRDIVTK